jgi:hypothetical protein
MILFSDFSSIFKKQVGVAQGIKVARFYDKKFQDSGYQKLTVNTKCNDERYQINFTEKQLVEKILRQENANNMQKVPLASYKEDVVKLLVQVWHEQSYYKC